MAYDSKGTVNKVILIGRLGQDPDVRYTPSGAATVTLSVATNTSYRGQDGNLVENTEWHRVVLWRQQAENAGKFLKKGSRVFVEGKLATRSWEDKDGVKHFTTEIIADQIQFLDARGEGNNVEAGAKGEKTIPPEPPIDEADDLPF